MLVAHHGRIAGRFATDLDAVTGAPNRVPGYGGQLQQRAIPGVAPEASVSIAYLEVAGTFADGTPYSLRVPSYSFDGSYESLSSKMLFGPRVAPMTSDLHADVRRPGPPQSRRRPGDAGRGDLLPGRVRDLSYPTVTTGTLAGVPSVTNQVIHPYTDLLLHDMGPDLADNRPDFQANGREWRTPPVCGIGLVQTVNGHSEFCTTAVREGKMGSESNFIIPTLLRWNDEIRL